MLCFGSGRVGCSVRAGSGGFAVRWIRGDSIRVDSRGAFPSKFACCWCCWCCWCWWCWWCSCCAFASTRGRGPVSRGKMASTGLASARHLAWILSNVCAPRACACPPEYTAQPMHDARGRSRRRGQGQSSEPGEPCVTRQNGCTAPRSVTHGRAYQTVLGRGIGGQAPSVSSPPAR